MATLLSNIIFGLIWYLKYDPEKYRITLIFIPSNILMQGLMIILIKISSPRPLNTIPHSHQNNPNENQTCGTRVWKRVGAEQPPSSKPPREHSARRLGAKTGFYKRPENPCQGDFERYGVYHSSPTRLILPEVTVGELGQHSQHFQMSPQLERMHHGIGCICLAIFQCVF